MIEMHSGYVLHRRRYGDNSLLLELFSEDGVRFAAIARGAAASRKGRSALLQPFVPLQLAWQGGGEVKTLNKVEALGTPLPLPGKAALCGLYLNELLCRLLARDDAHAELFQRYTAGLRELAAGANVEAPLRRFELDLLRVLGLLPALDVDCAGQAVVADQRYDFLPEAGARPAPNGQLSGSTLLRLANGGALSAEHRPEAKQLLRRLIEQQLDGRPLKSRELFRGIHRNV